jgi:hypothetical protein
VEAVLGVVAKVGLDLRVFWLPAPFVAFYRYNMMADSLRVEGHQVYFDASWHDVYLFFIYEKALDFITLTLWSRCISKNGYGRWLDSRLRWLDTHPRHCDPSKDSSGTSFVFYGATLPLGTTLRHCCGLDALGTLQAQSQQWRFGGHACEFSPPITCCEWLSVYYIKSFCGLGDAWKVLLDSRLRWKEEALRSAAGQQQQLSPAVVGAEKPPLHHQQTPEQTTTVLAVQDAAAAPASAEGPQDQHSRLKAPAAMALPPGWTQHTDESGDHWYSHSDGRTQWEVPQS